MNSIKRIVFFRTSFLGCSRTIWLCVFMHFLSKDSNFVLNCFIA